MRLENLFREAGIVPAVLILALAVSCGGSGCDPVIDRPDEPGQPEDLPEKIDIAVPSPSPDAVAYESIHDAAPDRSWFNMPQMNVSPSMYWTCVKGDDLAYDLLAQSLAGIVNRALTDGKTNVGIWLERDGDAYERIKNSLGKEIGRQTANELISKDYGDVDGEKVNIRNLVSGYVLCDADKNPESTVVATVASHVYNSVIVDVKNKAFFDNLGMEMKYDATNKSTADAWKEFKDKCSNKALVLMPVQIAELREFAIRNNLFSVNLNKRKGTDADGTNDGVLDEVLDWLVPDAPVLGWESGVPEDRFVSKISAKGKMMLAADWSYNHTLTSINAAKSSLELAKVVNPRNIDYSKPKHYVSFFLSDGDNYQWVMNGFGKDFYSVPEVKASKMSFGLCCEALDQLAPIQANYLISSQNASSTLMECFGGGYFYADNYAVDSDRKSGLEGIAGRAAASMRARRIKVLHLIAWDVKSAAAKEAYQAFVDANDQLEGIVAIQYSPYNGGNGDIIWVTNKDGYDIPVVTAKYSLWQGSNTPGQGTPGEIGARMKALNKGLTHDLVCIHAWSDFSGKKGAAAAVDCINAAGNSYEAVNIQEIIWRIRMNERREQTLKYLSKIK